MSSDDKRTTSSEGYYEHSRPEILALVPEESSVIIDVGCGAGALGAAMKRRSPTAKVFGVEVVTSEAEKARARLDDVVNQGAEKAPPSHWPSPECVVFADVLEHLVDPWSTLRSWTMNVRPGTRFVASIPNLGHYSVLQDLARGRFNYADEGLLDRTHLRFFAADSAEALLTGAGLRVVHRARVVKAPSGFALGPLWRRWATRGNLRLQNGQALSPATKWVLDFCTYQFLLVGIRGDEVV